MRIVSGRYGGRRLETPKDNNIRPTSDKVRGAIFNALQSRMDIEGAIVLDAFCGAGGLGLEALSRGAAHCTFIDKSRTSHELCKRNAQTLGADKDSTFLVKDSGKSLSGLPHSAYNLIFLDPPYNKGLIEKSLEQLEKENAIANDAILVLESEKNWSWSTSNYEILSEKIYGDTKILFTSPQVGT